jgi:hypothetical protein
MKQTIDQPEIRRLKLSLQAYGCGEEHGVVGDTIRALPCVFRVVAAPERHEISIWFRHPTAGLLGEIDRSLRFFGCGVVAGEMR